MTLELARYIGRLMVVIAAAIIIGSRYGVELGIATFLALTAIIA